jgi:hypothetical protein
VALDCCVKLMASLAFQPSIGVANKTRCVYKQTSSMARVPTKLDYVLDVYIDRSMVHKEHKWEGFHFDLLYHNVHSKTYNVDLYDFAHLAINLWYLSFLVKYFGHYRFQCCNCYHLLSVFFIRTSIIHEIISLQNC